MRTLLTLVLLSVSSLLMAQKSNLDSVNTDHSVLQAFISQLADQDIAVDIIMSQYMNIEHPSADIYDYLEVSLEEIRINLMTKNIADILYIPYNKMPKKDIKDIYVEGLNSNDIYFLYYKNRQMLALYLEDNKVASFTLVANGKGKAHFVLY